MNPAILFCKVNSSTGDEAGARAEAPTQSPSLWVLEQLLPQNVPVQQEGQEAGEAGRGGAAAAASDREEKNGAD